VDPAPLLEKYRGMDKLSAIFKMVEDSLKDGKESLILGVSTKEQQESWKKVAFALADEIFEAKEVCDSLPPEQAEAWRHAAHLFVEHLFAGANCLKARDWSDTQYKVDLNHLYDETADFSWFFFILLIKTKLTPETLMELIARKIGVNQFRFRSGY
jgi:hypothetical protein